MTFPSTDRYSFKPYLPPNAQLGFHRVGWRGTSGHADGGATGYNSADPKNCDAELVTVAQMGGSWINHLWHGPNSPFHHSVIEMAAATERAGMLFNLCPGSKIGVDTQSYIDAMVYAAKTFFNAPNYLMIGGRPVVKMFGPPAAVDFTKVRAAISSANPIFSFESFTHPEADSAFAWVHPQAKLDGTAIPDDFGLARILQFRDQAKAAPTKIPFYSIYKGFFDPWSQDPTKSVWLVNGARVSVRRMNDQGGLVALLTCSLLPADALWVLAATLDDFDEQTAMLNSQGTL